MEQFLLLTVRADCDQLLDPTAMLLDLVKVTVNYTNFYSEIFRIVVDILLKIVSYRCVSAAASVGCNSIDVVRTTRLLYPVQIGEDVINNV
jgi:hypothetical protein